ncbi:MAG: hypothetical protein QXX17_03815 [Conexivisphaerales archaeon]
MSVWSNSAMIGIEAIAPTFSEFGLYYFIFGMFAVLGIVMLALILMADPDPQYEVESL